MGNNVKLRLAVRAALALAAASASIPLSQAQTAQTASNEVPSTGLEEVVVTGSRIKSTNLVSISPVTTVTATDIQSTGLTRVEDILNNLPQVFAGQGANLSNGADGTATVDLHDLGAQRTLVLVNGRRLGPGGTTGLNASDINQVPAQLIEKVEVLTGGASATYGADAVSGVVNFILNTHFEGVKIDANYGMYQHSNHNGFAAGVVNAAGDGPLMGSVDSGFNKDLAVLLGSNFADGKGNATGYLTYTNQAAVLQRPFDYSACTMGGKITSPTNTKVSCGGSHTDAGGTFYGYNADYTQQLFYNTVDPKSGQFRAVAPSDVYNYGALNYYTRPNERWTAGTFLNYEVNEHATVYSELMFMKNNSTAQLAPGGDFGTANPTINCGPSGVGLPGNPLLTAQELSVICSPANIAAQAGAFGANSVKVAYLLRRNVEGGGRQELFTNESYRTVLGVKGDFAEAWKYDASAQYSNVTTIFNNLNYFSTASMQKALDVVTGPNGQPTCVSVINKTDPACVPWNVWVPGGVTQAALNYLNIPNGGTGTVSEYVAHADVSGDLGKYGLQLPTAKSGMQLNVGAEWREDTSSTNPDYATQQGLASGGAGPVLPISGQVHAAEVFTEFNLPIMDGLPGADQLAFEGGYRYSSYNLGFKTNTFKLGLEWAPVSDIRFRGGFNRAVRVPNISELYTVQTVGPGGTLDPCWGKAPTLTQAECARTGLNPAQYGTLAVNSSFQINTQSGGNPNLTPEKADTTSFGFVFQPTFLRGFSASIDYYDIKITNAIISTTGTATAIISDCALTNATAACSLIHRSASGSLWLSSSGFVSTPSANVGVISTRDVDLKTHYVMDMNGLGKLAFNLEGSYVIDNVITPIPGAPSYNCAGLWGSTCGNPLPKWRHVFSADWATPWSGLDFNLRWRYFGATKVDVSNGSPDLYYPGANYPGFNSISNYSYIDMSAAIAAAKNVTIRLGANNVLDKDPPTVLSGNCAAGPCNGNTFAQTYDVLGRYLYVHATVQF
ncbi:MAG TPA: TonB-dependent receptor [Steroidobacteraceae bacterium]